MQGPSKAARPPTLPLPEFSPAALNGNTRFMHMPSWAARPRAPAFYKFVQQQTPNMLVGDHADAKLLATALKHTIRIIVNRSTITRRLICTPHRVAAVPTRSTPALPAA